MSAQTIFNRFYSGTTNPGDTERINFNGYFYATKVFNPVFGDIAEYMFGDFSKTATAGDVLVQGDAGLKPSEFRGDPRVVGVYSDTFGYALGADNTTSKHPVGLAGIVFVKVKESLNPGDLLISSENGFATKAQESERVLGVVLGKVLENKEDNKPSRIKMLII